MNTNKITMKSVIKMYKNQNIFFKKVEGKKNTYEMTTNFDMGGTDITELTKAQIIQLAIKDSYDYGWWLDGYSH